MSSTDNGHSPAAPVSGVVEGSGEMAGITLDGAMKLRDFIAAAPALSRSERETIVDQAILLLGQLYVHLPLKRVMYAVDPVRRLELLRNRLPQVDSDLAFHNEMCEIVNSLRDLHTNYLLPEPYKDAVAFLPFQIEECFDGERRKYVVSHLATGFEHPTFGPEAEVLSWNGVPIERAIEIVAARNAGGNPDARRARGLARLTVRALAKSPPPDEEWAIIGYRSAAGDAGEVRLDWKVFRPIPADAVDHDAIDHNGTALAFDLEFEHIRHGRKALFASHVIAREREIADRTAATGSVLTAVEGMQSTMPAVFDAQPVDTQAGRFGYIRVRTFMVDDPGAFVDEFVRLVENEAFPQNGLIIDLRDNGGGLIFAGEQLLQILTPRTIEPERMQFINTPLSLRLCEIQSSLRASLNFEPWVKSIQRAIEETGSTFSASFPVSLSTACNAIGQRYYGPVVLIVNALCYSTTDIFTAGFQDHRIGKILGTSGNTGAGGANVFTHEQLKKLFAEGGTANMPNAAAALLSDLPKGAGLRIALRRALRVGAEAGTELEDLGVTPDEIHQMTPDDLLHDNVDLIEHAARLLLTVDRPACALRPGDIATTATGFAFDLSTGNLDRLDLFANGRPLCSIDVADGTRRIDVPNPAGTSIVLDIRGYKDGGLAAARRMRLGS